MKTNLASSSGLELPDGFVVQLRADLLRPDAGRVLVGGSPVRAVRLSTQAHGLIGGDRLTVVDPTTAALARRLLEGNLADPVLDAVNVSPPEITVVVPVRDRPVQLDRCLAALAPLRMIVVDDASQDPDSVVRVARRHGATVLRLPANVGPAGARNAGLARVSTPLVAFVDSDVEVEGYALLELARHCRDPRVALVGPVVAGVPRTSNPRWFETYDAAASSLDLGRVGGQVRPGNAVGWLPSACLVGRVAHLASGFDDTLRVGEDVDLVWRLTEAGFVVRYDPTVRARHDVRSTLGGWLERKFVYGTGGADLGIRHGDKVAPAVLSPTMAICAAALLQRRWWSIPTAAGGVVLTARLLAPRLPVEDGRNAIAATLALRATGWAVRQECGLLLRHWWPAAALTAVLSPVVRRALASALLVDLAVFLHERTDVHPIAAIVGRRLDDLAYGSGLWWGAIRRRNLRCLAVRRLRPLRPATRTSA